MRNYRRNIFFIIVIVTIFSLLLFNKPFKKNNKAVEEDVEGYVTFWFDDGMLSTFEVAYAMLKEYDWPAVLAVIGNRDVAVDKYKDVEGVVDWEDVLFLQNQEDWEISNHSLSHMHLNNIDDEKILQNEIAYSLRLIEEKGLSINSFTFPYGEQGGSLGQKIVSDNHLYWRSSTSGVNSVPAWRHLTSYFFNNDTSEEEVLRWIKETKDVKGWLILGLHSTLDKPVTIWEHTPEQFAMLLDIIKESNLKVVIPNYMFNTYGFAEDL